MTETKYDYGRQPIKRGRPAALPVDDGKPSCAKCRCLCTAGGETSCGAAMPLEAEGCARFSDAGRPRDFFPHFFHSDMRR